MDHEYDNDKPRRPLRWGRIITILVVVLVVIYGGYYFASRNNLLFSSQDSSTYQAVFLNNSQVYFGKLSTSGDWIILQDVYYLKATDNLQSTSTTNAAALPTSSQPKIELVKLGNELHGPEDKMFISRDKVIFWENMKPGSKVIEAIKAYKNATP